MGPIDDMGVINQGSVQQYIEKLEIFIGTHLDLVPAQPDAGRAFVCHPPATQKGGSRTQKPADGREHAKGQAMGRRIRHRAHGPPQNSPGSGQLCFGQSQEFPGFLENRSCWSTEYSGSDTSYTRCPEQGADMMEHRFSMA